MDIRVTAEVDTSGWERDIEALRLRLDRATRDAVNDGLALIERETKLRLMMRSHPPRTKTPSPPGEPPAMITGHMARSTRSEPAAKVGYGRWRGKVGATVVQARIQELGGHAGRGHRAHLPPRPYLRPSTKAVESQIRRRFVARWGEAISRG